MRLVLLSGDDIRQALPMPAAIEAMKEAFAELSTGAAVMPPRLALPIPSADAVSLYKPAYRDYFGYFSTWLCDRWNGDAEPSQMMKTFRISYRLEFTPKPRDPRTFVAVLGRVHRTAGSACLASSGAHVHAPSSRCPGPGAKVRSA